MRTAAYARFSSDRQREASIRDQLRNIEGHCARMGWTAPEVFKDEAVSGARNDRPGYLALLEAIKAGRFDVLLIDDLTRLSRDDVELAQTLRRLTFAGVRVIGVSDGTDTARKGHKIETGLRGLMGALYLEDLAEKTHRGLTGQALAGYSAGGLPYGYDSVPDGEQGFRRVIKENEAKWVRHIFGRYADGYSARQIADELNRLKVPSPRGGTWAHSAIYPDSKGVGILANDLYRGVQVWNRTKWVKDPETGRRLRTMRPRGEWIVTEHPELRIVDQATWEACERRTLAMRSKTANMSAAARKAAAGGRGPKYLLSGLLKCGECGGAFVILDAYRYGCATHRNRGPAACSNGARIARSTTEEQLLESVKRDLLSERAFRAFEAEARRLLKDAQPDPSEARKVIAQAEKERDNILAAIRAGIVTPSTKAELERAEHQIEEARRELDKVLAFEPAQMLPRAREIYRDLVARLQGIEDVNRAREALRSLIGEVRIVREGEEVWAESNQAGLAGLTETTMVAGAGWL